MTDVLIVEPSKDLAIIIAQALARQERTSTVAHTSQAAIEQTDKTSPRLVILEPIIPRHNGLEFIHELRSYPEWLNIPIILYSQLTNEELDISEEILRDMGIAEHLYKPTSSLQELVRTVEKYLE